MCRPDRMDMDGQSRETAGQTTGPAGVVEMNMGEKDTARRLIERLDKPVEGQSRTGVDHPAVDQVGGDHLFVTEIAKVDDRYR